MIEKELNNFIDKHKKIIIKQTKFYNVNINEDNNKKTLLVDGYNYINKFFNVGEEVNHSKLYDIEKRINRFIDYCKKDNYKLIIFIDAYIKTQETLDKWIKRRENEVKLGKKSVPYCVGTILYHYFCKKNIPVYFSYTHDNDDTIASYASEIDNCYILSGDHDFFRYNYKIYPTVYNNFYYKNDRINFTDHNRKRPNIGVKFRDVIYPLPKVSKKNPVKDNLLKYNISVRGVVTSQCKYFGNVHRRIRSLRRKCYYNIFYDKMKNLDNAKKLISKNLDIFNHSALKIQILWFNYKTTITERYPEWDKKNEIVIWKEENIKPLKYNKLESFSNILNKYFPNKFLKKVKDKIKIKSKTNKIASIRFTNYLFSIYASLLELICICQDKNIVDEIDKHFIKKIICNKCYKIEYLDIINYNWYKNKFNSVPKKCYKCRKNINLNI